MKIGIVGLGRMGAGLAERLRRHGHEVVGYDRNPEISQVASYQQLVDALSPPRVVWLMVPAGDATQATIDEVGPLLAGGDIVVDGGNSYYKDSVRRAADLAERDVKFLDAGTSGGVWGLEEGFCLMVG
ncbi:MAG: NAD(P)-binding domain-containing protein, partial [Dehalococcoidia bacterium]